MKRKLAYTSLAMLSLVATQLPVVEAEEVVPTQPQENQVGDQASQVEALTTEKTQLTEELTAVTKDLTKYQAAPEIKSLSEHEAEEKALVAEVEALTTERTALAIEKEHLVKRVDELITEETPLKDEVAFLLKKANDPEVKKLVEEVTALTAESASKTAQKAEAEDQLTRANQMLQELATKEKQLSDRLDELTLTQDMTATEVANLMAEKTQKVADFNRQIQELEDNIRQAETNVQRVFENDPVRYNDMFNRIGMEVLKYQGTFDAMIELTPEQKQELQEKGYFSYTPDSRQINAHVIDYLNQLRQLNGISDRVSFSEDSFQRAQARAKEMSDTNSLTHTSNIPTNKPTTSENIEQRTVKFDTDFSNPDVLYFNDAVILSDRQYAYNLILNWFADYTNVAVGQYNHRETLFNPVRHFGTAVYGKPLPNNPEYKHYFASMNTVDPAFKNPAQFGPSADGQSWLMNGREMVFLPRTRFIYTVTTRASSDDVRTKEELIGKRDTYVDQTDLRIVNLNALLAAARNQLTTHNRALTDTRDALASQEASIQPLTDKIVTLSNRLTEVSARQVELSSLLSGRQVDGQELTNKQNRLSQLTASRSAAQGRLNEVNNRLTMIDGSLPQKNERLGHVRQAIVPLSINVQSFREQETTLTEKKAQLTNRLEAINALIQSLKPQAVSGLAGANVINQPPSDGVTQGSRPVVALSKAPVKANNQKIRPNGGAGAAGNTQEQTIQVVDQPANKVFVPLTTKTPVEAERTQTVARVLPKTADGNTHLFVLAAGLGLTGLSLAGLNRRRSED